MITATARAIPASRMICPVLTPKMLPNRMFSASLAYPW